MGTASGLRGKKVMHTHTSMHMCTHVHTHTHTNTQISLISCSGKIVHEGRKQTLFPPTGIFQFLEAKLMEKEKAISSLDMI